MVEDDESSSFLLGEILKKTKAKIDFSTTGVSAVEYIRDNPQTDLVLMDIQLPDIDGLTATKEIKQINKKVMVITQSAYLQYAPFATSGELAADDFVPKPINPKVLLAKIEKCFNAA